MWEESPDKSDFDLKVNTDPHLVTENGNINKIANSTPLTSKKNFTHSVRLAAEH